jgi:hypothetical protein
MNSVSTADKYSMLKNIDKATRTKNSSFVADRNLDAQVFKTVLCHSVLGVYVRRIPITYQKLPSLLPLLCLCLCLLCPVTHSSQTSDLVDLKLMHHCGYLYQSF